MHFVQNSSNKQTESTHRKARLEPAIRDAQKLAQNVFPPWNIWRGIGSPSQVPSSIKSRRHFILVLRVVLRFLLDCFRNETLHAQMMKPMKVFFYVLFLFFCILYGKVCFYSYFSLSLTVLHGFHSDAIKLSACSKKGEVLGFLFTHTLYQVEHNQNIDRQWNLY